MCAEIRTGKIWNENMFDSTCNSLWQKNDIFILLCYRVRLNIKNCHSHCCITCLVHKQYYSKASKEKNCNKIYCVKFDIIKIIRTWKLVLTIHKKPSKLLLCSLNNSKISQFIVSYTNFFLQKILLSDIKSTIPLLFILVRFGTSDVFLFLME